MSSSSRFLRRAIIVIVFIAILGLVWWAFQKINNPAPTCTDGLMNGLEEGVDCGLFSCNNYCEPVLAPPKVASTKLIKAGDMDYDFVAEIENPNKDFGASEIVYDLKLFNGSNTEILKEGGVFYILPNQKKFLILSALTTDREVSRVEFDIKNASWQKLDSLDGMSLIVRQEKYTETGSWSTISAGIFNDSDFDFGIVDIDVVLFNSKDEIVAVGRSDIRTFLAKTERHFEVKWPFEFSDKMARFEIHPLTNLFENYNFIKSYGSPIEKFQEYR